MWHDVIRIARKELGGFFASPAAFLFLGAFLIAVLFAFFWVETFFARNIADLRPLFKWLPVLLIFLVAALSMRTWSEERRAGTLESLLTSPVSTLSLVLGKFLAGLALVAIALLLTLPLPVTVAFLGPLDWGPVVGGYVATLFLAAAYLAIGQFMSARTDNPVVALILAALVCGAFYLIGSEAITGLFSTSMGHILSLVGTGSRFESITRGVLDLRDIYYYLSLVGLFLVLNLFSLERLRRAGNPATGRHRRQALAAALLVANFVAANFWLAPVTTARADITAGRMYSLSQATKETLQQASEPLLIRGYFSPQTHPLLAPLVPQLRDLLEEYGVAGGRNVRVEFVNPQESPEKEEEANARYGVRPVPFQTASKYQTSVVSSYFNVVVAYGDQSETLGFRDLIDVKAREAGEFDVRLRDPEYAVTRAIRKVVGGYRAGSSPFDVVSGDIALQAYVSSPERLPEGLRGTRTELEAVLAELARESGGRLKVSFQDPDAGGGELGRKLAQRFGLRPQVAGLMDAQPFWFTLMLESKGRVEPVTLPPELNRQALRESVLASVKRLAPGVLKTVGLMLPVGGQSQPPSYDRLREVLEQNVRITEVSLASGQVPAEVDLLMVLSPGELNAKQVFALDQFLMQGGSVVLATSAFEVMLTDRIETVASRSGLEEWLAFQGITIDKSMVMDNRNAALPVPTMRRVGPVMVPEMRMLPYPPFADVRDADLSTTNPITSSLNQLTINWASPLLLDSKKQGGRQVSILARSSDEAWRDPAATVMPDFERFPDAGFGAPEKREQSNLAVAIEGRFESFFKGKPVPQSPEGQPEAAPQAQRVTEHSPATARLIVVGANSFASDVAIDIASRGMGTLYTAPMAFLQNAIDWSLEDRSLLSLRGRSQTAHTLVPVGKEQQQFWETANYAAALIGLFIVWLVRRIRRKAREQRYREILKEVGA